MLICPRDGGAVTRQFEVRPMRRYGSAGTREVEAPAWCDQGHFLDRLGEVPIEAPDAE